MSDNRGSFTEDTPSLAEIIKEVKQQSDSPAGQPAAAAGGGRGSPGPDWGQEESGRNDRKMKKKLLIAGGVTAGALAVFMGVSAAFLYIYPNVFPGVKAGGFSVAGLSQSEANREIANHFQNELSNKKVQLSINGELFDIPAGEVTDGIDAYESAKTAYEYGREGNFFKRAGAVIGALTGNADVPLSVSMKEDALEQKIDEIGSDALAEPVPPSYELAGDSLILNTGKPGVRFDGAQVAREVSEKIAGMDFTPYEVEVSVREQPKPNLAEIIENVNAEPRNAQVDKTDKTGKTILPHQDGVKLDLTTLQQAVGDGTQQTYTIPVQRTPAAVKEQDLRAVLFRDKLASVTTNLNAGQKARTSNVRLAAQKINGTILNPGEEFSYNDTVGPRTYATGFLDAKVFASGEVVDGVGGGICQTSTTLYMAVLRADLKVSQRRNHTFAVTYAPLSQDATVAYGVVDFKFVNDTDYPLRIAAEQSGSHVTVELYGTKTVDKEVTLSTEVLGRTNFNVIEKEDKSLKPGQKKTEQGGYTGYQAVLYKTVTIDGKSTKTKVNSSTYSKLDKIVLVGPKAEETKPTEPAVQPPAGQPEQTAPPAETTTPPVQTPEPEQPEQPAEQSPAVDPEVG